MLAESARLWKSETKLRAGLAIANVHAAGHRDRELPHEREADARAHRLARELVLGAIEELEDLLHLALRDAGTEVAHGEQQGAVALRPARDLHRLALRAGRELERVVDEVDEDLRERVAV